MPKAVHKNAGIEPLGGGVYRARVYFNGKAFEKKCSTQAKALEWQRKLHADLARCPEGVQYVKGSWIAELSHEGQPVIESFQTLTEAESWYRSTEALINTGVYKVSKNAIYTLNEFIPIWLESKVRAGERTQQRYMTSLRSHVLPYFGARKLRTIEQSEVREWIQKLIDSGFSDDAISKAGKYFKQVLKFAENAEYITSSPIKAISLPSVIVREKMALSRDEAMMFADEFGDYKALIMFMVATGLRDGEMRALLVSDIDFKTNEVSVSKAATLGDGFKTKIGPTKTKATRKVVIPEFLMEDLKVFTDGKTPDMPLFHGSRGGMLNYGWFRRTYFIPACKKLGLKDFGMHNLRHTCASLHIQQGVNIVVLSKILGHSTVTETLNTYSHMYVTDKQESAAALNSLFTSGTGQERGLAA